MNRFQLPIIEKKIIAKDALEVSFGISEVKFDFLAGQYIRVVLPKMPKDAEPRGNGREFSIASSPNNKERLTVVFRLSGSKFKQALANASLGEMVVVEGPYGNMTFPKNLSSISFIAGGTGVAPFLSMIRYASEQNLPNKIRLLCADKSEDRCIYFSELAAIEKQNNNFKIEKIHESITPEILDRFVYGENKIGRIFYVSGHPDMVDSVINMLLKAGISESQIYFEESNLTLYPDHTFFSSILQRSLEGVFVSDLRGIIKFANNSWEQLSGWKSEEVIDKFTPRIIKSGQHDDEFYAKFWTEILFGISFRYNFINKRKDGGFYNVDEVTMPIRSASGVIIGFITFQRDIGDRLRLEEQLRRSAAQLAIRVEERTQELQNKIIDLENASRAVNNLLEDLSEEKQQLAEAKSKDDAILYSIGDGVFVVDVNYKIMLFNAAASRISGFSAEEVIGKKYHEILKFIPEGNGDLRVSFIKQTIETGKPHAVEKNINLITKDGRKIPVADSAAPIKDEMGKVSGCVVVFRDVAKEREIDRAKTEFISIASHQLRTPLSAIKWTIDLLLEKAHDANEKARLTDLYKSNERLIRLVSDLLNVSRIESGRILTEVKLSNLSKLIQDSLSALSSKADLQNKKISLSLSKDLENINLDPVLFVEAFKNVVDNSINYSPPASEIRVAVGKEGQNCVISVHNEGQPIPATESDKIFTKFFRGDMGKKFRGEGSGLGLYFAKSAIEHQGGKIWFENPAEGGVTFYISLSLK